MNHSTECIINLAVFSCESRKSPFDFHANGPCERLTFNLGRKASALIDFESKLIF